LETRINYIVGASMLITRDFHQRTGKMREDYFLYCEEVEWCLRAIRQGERLGYAPDAVVLHAQGTATGGGGALKTRSRAAIYLSERNRILLTRDVFPGHLAITAPLSLLHLLIKYGKAGAWRQAGYAISGWLAGLRNERGKPHWLENGVTNPNDRPA
jgi:GT2 family glycosyltransferase